MMRYQIMRNKVVHVKTQADIKEENTDIEKLAYIINSVDGKEPSPEAKNIIHLYAKGEIDFETAELAILKMYQQ